MGGVGGVGAWGDQPLGVTSMSTVEADLDHNSTHACNS